ncbi:MAG: ABC transporter permease subunit [Anaerolineales bacterium]|nr:ABC transporter permease subunit [Anaerolineales bacterium]
MKRFEVPIRILFIVLVAIIAWSLRARAVEKLNIDFDEDDYMRAGQEYTHLIRTSNWSGFLDTNYRPEHPPLAKIVIGLSLLSAPEKDLIRDAPTTSEPNKYLPRELVKPARTTNAILGWLTVILLAIINPLAGLALATHTFTIKYVSQIMLEALPALTSFITVLAYLQFKKKEKTNWLITSAIFLGLTAASKYLYCFVGIAILIDWFLEAKSKEKIKPFLRQALVWGVIAFAIFFIANPYLWTNPIGRLQESVFYHAQYSSSAEEVNRAGYPFWQPFNWLFFSPIAWHEDVFLFAPDIWITLLAVIGLTRLWKRERVYVLWIGVALLFLLFWKTKWPQYIIIFTVPLSLSAAEGIATLWNQLVEWWKNRQVQRTTISKNEARRAIPWLVPGLIAFAIFTIFPLIFQVVVSMTDFNSASIRDGFQGGIWRAFWEGITGQIPISEWDGSRANQVRFTGLTSYPFVFNEIANGNGSGNSILFFNIMWAVVSVILQGGLGLGVALLLWQRGVQLGKFWQALFILPWAIPEMIGALMWFNIFQREWGWLYLAAEKFGADSFFGVFTRNLENSPSLWLITFLLPALWYGFPFMMLAASTGLKIIPKEVYDAAAMDGANAMQTFRYVTLPLLLPLLLPAIIVRGIFAFNQFYLFQTFYFLDGTLATLSYNVFNPTGYFGGGQFATSAVINIITVLILIIFVSMFNRWSKAEEGVVNA